MRLIVFVLLSLPLCFSECQAQAPRQAPLRSKMTVTDNIKRYPVVTKTGVQIGFINVGGGRRQKTSPAPPVPLSDPAVLAELRRLSDLHAQGVQLQQANLAELQKLVALAQARNATPPVAPAPIIITPPTAPIVYHPPAATAPIVINPPAAGAPIIIPPVSGAPIIVPPVSGAPIIVPPVSGAPPIAPPVSGAPPIAPPSSGPPPGGSPPPPAALPPAPPPPTSAPSKGAPPIMLPASSDSDASAFLRLTRTKNGTVKALWRKK